MYIKMSLLFITLTVCSSEYNPEEIDLAHITEVEYSAEDKIEKYTAYLGPKRGNDRIIVSYHNVKKFLSCTRYCHFPKNITMLPSSYFDLIKTKYQQQTSNKN
jgi:hypothetical protein